MDRQQGRAEYTVDWSGQGYEQLAQQMREFLTLKRQVDAELRRGFAQGPAATGLVGAGGQPLSSPHRAASAQVDQQYDASRRAVADANRQYARALAQEARHHEQAARTSERQQQRATAADFADRLRGEGQAPSVFAGMAGTGLKSDADYLAWHRAIQQRYETALKNNEELSQADRRILGSANQIAGIIRTRQAQEEGAARRGFLAKAIGVAGSVGPPELYYAQMGLGEWGLGLGPVGIAAGLGVGALGALGLGVVNTVASQTQMARMLAGITAGGSGTAVGPADQAFADQLTTMGASFGLDRGQMFKLLPTAAEGNLGSRAAIGGVMQTGLTLASQGQLSNEQGIGLANLLVSRNGGDVAAAQREIARLDGAIVQMGADTHTVYQAILEDGAALKAGTDLTQFAGVAAALQGTGLHPMDVLGGTRSTGVQRLAQAAALGMSESSYTDLQLHPEDYAQRLQQYTQGLLDRTGSQSVTEEILAREGFIAGGDNADQVLASLRSGNFRPRPATAGPPVPPEALGQSFQAMTVQAMTVNTLSLPWQSRVGLVGQDVMQALAQPLTLPGTQAVHHLLEIVVKDVTGQVLGSTTATISGSSTQTQTTVPGQGPPATVATGPAATPNRTNTNGR